jgi:hypothetical protein
MARVTPNGEPRVLACGKHPDKSITIYGSPDTVAWCPCGSQLRPASSSSSRAPRRRSPKKDK